MLSSIHSIPSAFGLDPEASNEAVQVQSLDLGVSQAPKPKEKEAAGAPLWVGWGGVRWGGVGWGGVGWEGLSLPGFSRLRRFRPKVMLAFAPRGPDNLPDWGVSYPRKCGFFLSVCFKKPPKQGVPSRKRTDPFKPFKSPVEPCALNASEDAGSQRNSKE